MTDMQTQSLVTKRKSYILIVLLPIILLLVVAQSLMARGVENSLQGSPAQIGGQIAPSNVVSSTDGSKPSGAVITETIYLPIVFKPLPIPTLLSVGMPTTNNNFATYGLLASWQDLGDPTLTYILEESTDANFSSPTAYNAGAALSYNVIHTPSTQYTFYYRVRTESGSLQSAWSNVIMQSGPYSDDFSDSSSGWAIRREDTDETDNSVSYTDGKLRLKVGGRWDSMIASPMAPSPTTWPGYRINTRVKLTEGIDNLHSYGIVFGADWDKTSPCPNSTFSSCFNRYYRLNVIWNGDSSTLKAELKRIDSHNPSNNTNTGKTLMSFREVFVGDPNGWVDWTFDVYTDGTINLYANEALFATVHDTTYQKGGRYFGTFASADEYLGTAALFEFYQVLPLE